jgi:UDP-N-acetylglucosamine:LPS N-acetylglucosamine transferase
MPTSSKRVLAVASGGGHWVELLRVVPALSEHAVSYATVQADYARDVPEAKFYLLKDATRWNPFATLTLAAQVLLLLLRTKPDVVISTGAAPGYFAVRFGKLVGARTIWLDSLANVDALSKSGQMARKYSDLWLTQWEHLADSGGPEYCGQVI